METKDSKETTYIRREISVVIEEAYRYFPVITVTGPRQSGKTTLLRNLFPHLPYYSLENPDVRSFAGNDPVAFLNRHAEGMVEWVKVGQQPFRNSQTPHLK